MSIFLKNYTISRCFEWAKNWYSFGMILSPFQLFTTVLLESHKVRIMFRKSGGYICLMTLLLHLEGALSSNKAQETLKNLNTEASNSQHQPSRQETLTHIAMIFHVFVVSMRYEPSNAKYFLTEVSDYSIPVQSRIKMGSGSFNFFKFFRFSFYVKC